MTIEDIRKENKAVFDKIDAEFAPDERKKQYSGAYACVLRNLEKKETSAYSYVRPDKKAIAGIIVAIVLLVVVGVFYTIATGNDTKNSEFFICVIAYCAAAIVAIVSISVFTARYVRWKKISNRIAFLKEYMLHDEDMYKEYDNQIEREKRIENMSAFVNASMKKSNKSTPSVSSSSSSSFSSSASEQSSGGYFSSPSNRVNYKDGYRDAGYSENGKMYDSNNRQIGYIDDNDKVYDNNYNAVGWFDDNGTYHNY